MNDELINQMSVEDIDKLGSPNKVITIKPYTAIIVCTIVSIPFAIPLIVFIPYSLNSFENFFDYCNIQ